MNLNNLPKTTARSAKRLGRGLGSGKAKTAGRGQKGQKARGKVPAFGVGGGLLLYKKLPYRRGFTRHGGNPPKALKPIKVKTSQLNALKANSVVNLENLIAAKLVSEKQAKRAGVKILVTEPLKIALIVELPVSQKARELIEKAGGTVKV